MAGKGNVRQSGLFYSEYHPPALSSESSPYQYTSEKIEERLDYAVRMGKRVLTRRSEIFLQLYKAGAENALEASRRGGQTSFLHSASFIR
jgi:hypothetical protein